MTETAPKAGATEGELERIKASIEKYTTGDAEPTAKALADLTKAVRDLSDQVATHERRIEAIENTHPEWTTHGWEPPPGSNIPPSGSEDPPP
jgi:hypothetical protein